MEFFGRISIGSIPTLIPWVSRYKEGRSQQSIFSREAAICANPFNRRHTRSIILQKARTMTRTRSHDLNPQPQSSFRTKVEAEEMEWTAFSRVYYIQSWIWKVRQLSPSSGYDYSPQLWPSIKTYRLSFAPDICHIATAFV